MSRRKPPGKPPDSNVIRVAFGPGGGRVRDAGDGVRGGEPMPEPGGREPVTDLYTQTEVAKLLDVSRGRLRSLDRAGVVSPSGWRRGRRAYTFNDLIALRAARDLLNQKVRPRDVARAIERIQATLPKVTRPLSELRIASDGKKVVVRTTEGSFEPLTGQMVIDFGVKQLQDDVVRVLRPTAARDRTRQAYEMYVRASRLDEDPDTMDEAEELYRQAIQHDPWLAIAYTNLGNIRFRLGDEAQAEALYRRALELETTQPEAQYNLGYMMLHRGRAADSVTYFEGAIQSDPQFADAYFNLAMAYEETKQRDKACHCWQRYLELEPSGTWAEIARQHLDE